MQIEITPTEQQQLAAQAAAAGYEDVSQFVRAKILGLLDQSESDSHETAQASISTEEIRQAEQEIAADRVSDAREAMLEIGARRGYRLPE